VNDRNPSHLDRQGKNSDFDWKVIGIGGHASVSVAANLKANARANGKIGSGVPSRFLSKIPERLKYLNLTLTLRPSNRSEISLQPSAFSFCQLSAFRFQPSALEQTFL
jgi:hypothetical protein